MIAAAAMLFARPAAADCVVVCPVHNGTCGVSIVVPDSQCGGGAAQVPTPDPQAEAKAREAERQERAAAARQRGAEVRAETLRSETKQMKLEDHMREEAERVSREAAEKNRKTMEAESSAYGDLLNADDAHRGAKLPPKDPYDTPGKKRGPVRITGSAATLPLASPREVPPEHRAKAAELAKQRDEIAAKIAETEKALSATDRSEQVKVVELKQQLSDLTSKKNTLQVHIDDLSARRPSARPTPQHPPLVPPEPGK